MAILTTEGKVLQRYRHIAIVGISSRPTRPSFAVASYLQAAGYDIIPINPRYAGTMILGRPVYATLAAAHEAGESLEIVDVFRRAEQTPAIVEEALAVGAQVLWLQLGIINEETARRAHAAGLTYIEDRCTKIEHARLLAAESEQVP